MDDGGLRRDVGLALPYASARVCTAPACGTLVRGSSRCPAHPYPKRKSAARRGYGRAWQKIRASKLRRSPLCEYRSAGVGWGQVEERCSARATNVDHIIPRARGGSDEAHNLQSLCASHHSTKTAREDGGFGNEVRV